MGKCVEIELSDDGQFTVSECAPKEEAMPGEEGGEPAGQQYQSADEAMQAAMQLLTADTRSPEDQAQEGYNRGAKPDRPPVKAVFGGDNSGM